MGLVFRGGGRRKERLFGINNASDLIPRRGVVGSGLPYVNEDSALGHSAVWAAIRIRSDLISTLPIDGYRYVDLGEGKIQVEAGLSPFMLRPEFMEWRYSSQVELDRSGNSIGIITEKTSTGLAANIDLYPSSACSVFYRNGKMLYRINGVEYDPSNIWHEKQYTVSGCPVGLSPVAYAAYTLGQYKSIQDFASNWFMNGQGPRASLRNTEKKLGTKDIALAEETWRASQSLGVPFVHGSDWEYSLIAAEHASTDWLEAMKLSNVDVARFFNVPADVIDAAMAGGPSMTYANVVQKNLQFLIMNLNPAIIRRENAYSQLLPRPRFAKHNTDAFLRMDPQTRAAMIQTQINSRVICPSEARALDNRAPYTAAQIKEFDEVGLNKAAPTKAAPVPDQAPPTDQGLN